ncbi:MAG TPA: hypothetical protein VLN74_02425 [Ilumatobacteraceae bacterium]|nr:hypothetical protein [Ilumatobacteraceae bacterium]
MHSTASATAYASAGNSRARTRQLGARGSRIALLAVANVVALLAAAGFVAAYVALFPAQGASVSGAGPGVGDTVATSYGTITVQHVETIDGLTTQELGGMSHGIADLVQTDEAQVLVSVLLANASDDPIFVEPGQFALLVEGSTDALVPTSSTVKPLELQPGASVEASVIFVAPLSGAAISIGYSDPTGSVVVIPAGGLDQAPVGDTTDDHATDHAPDS